MVVARAVSRKTSIYFIVNQSAELKNCSKKTPGFERCECLQEMDESNADRVKVKEFDILCETPSCLSCINIAYMQKAGETCDISPQFFWDFPQNFRLRTRNQYCTQAIA